MSDIITVGADYSPNTKYEFKNENGDLTLRKLDLLPEDHPVLHQEPLTWIFDPPQDLSQYLLQYTVAVKLT
jgi:hypothetical protein